MSPDPARPRLRRLRPAHAVLSVLHAAQAAVVLLLTTDFSIPLTASFPEGPPGTPPPAPEALVDWPLGVLVAGFLLLAALDHLVVALPRVNATYTGLVARGRNPFRWAEYAVSSTLMVLLIGLLSGVTEITAVLGIAGANVAMILFGHRAERVNEGRTSAIWQPFVFGCVAGAFPWLAIGANIAGAGQDVPTFVYGIFVSLFVLFMSFAANQYLQLRALSRGGRWADPAFVEQGYLVLSLVAKSLLAWQVFANVLVS